MATGIFAILDDIATLLDDTAVLSKIAAKKTVGLLGDDLAVNAEQSVGFKASRELPVIWAITKGSLINKLIIIPIALLLSAYLPWLIIPILLLGGVYLSFEGMEKIFEWIFNKFGVKKFHNKSHSEKTINEKAKIKAAIRTDFILSIEIIVVSLGTVVGHNIVVQVLVVSLIALLATAGVYGFVALLVRLDDIGFYLIEKGNKLDGLLKSLLVKTGRILTLSLPYIIRILQVIGTMAMLIVGGGMFVHNIEYVHNLFHFLPTMISNFIVGAVIGSITFFIIKLIKG